MILDKRHYDPTCSDYINASFVQDNAHEDLPRYIATQGPLPSTVSDFWTMVLQQRCPVIIMLVGVVDGDQVSKVILSSLNMHITSLGAKISLKLLDILLF